MTAGVVITIDGPAGAGKSTAARGLAEELRFEFLDTGAMYRAVTRAVLESEGDPEDEDAAAAVARELRVEWRDGQISVDGEPPGASLRTPEVDRAVSAVSAHPGVRREIVAHQRLLARGRRVVAEGRDTGSVVFPGADVRFYLDASPQERARRRAEEIRARGGEADPAEIRRQIEERDRRDSHRRDSPLRFLPGMVLIDSTRLSQAEVIELLRRKALERLSARK